MPKVSLKSPTVLRVYLLGPLRIERAKGTVRLPTHKIESLFAYLGEVRRVWSGAAQATIRQVWETGTMVGGNPLAGLLLEVCPLDRPAYQVQTTAVIPRRQLPAFQPGELIVVKLDPSDSSKVHIPMSRFPRATIAWGGSHVKDDEQSKTGLK